MHACVRVHACMHVCVRACVCVHLSVCVPTCMNVTSCSPCIMYLRDVVSLCPLVLSPLPPSAIPGGTLSTMPMLTHSGLVVTWGVTLHSRAASPGCRRDGLQGGQGTRGRGPLKSILVLCSILCSQPLEPFCEDQQSPTRVRTSCTPDYLSVGRCNLVQYTAPVDSIYRVRPFTLNHSHTCKVTLSLSLLFNVSP